MAPLRTLGMIPARGGSKGVPRKNLRKVAGRPLLAWAIDAAAGAKRITNFVVSTDDAEIEATARDHGADVIRRPAALADDAAPMAPVAIHALDEAAKRWGPFDSVAVLQPTTPQRTGADVDGALEILARTGATSVVSVYEVEDLHPARMYTMGPEERLLTLDPTLETASRQFLPALYHRNGAVYAARADYVRSSSRLLGPDVRAYRMPRSRSLNIDDEHDLLVADLLLSRGAGA